MKDIVIALSILSALLGATVIVLCTVLVKMLKKRARIRNCDLCEDVDDAFRMAVHEGVIDGSKFTARDMAAFLLDEAGEDFSCK